MRRRIINDSSESLDKSNALIPKLFFSSLQLLPNDNQTQLII